MSWSKLMKTIPVLSALVLSLTTGHVASALTADVAKKCREMMVKAFPPQIAGSGTGRAREERSYFQACVARGGRIDDAATPPDGRGSK
jgi:hypothetical protein